LQDLIWGLLRVYAGPLVTRICTISRKIRTNEFSAICFCPAAVNYVAVTEALGASPSIVAAGLAADNLICAIYFTTLFALATSIPPDSSSTLGAHPY